ncbi:hypothetical protein QJS10_CPB22g00311 [Acorus calamus]|uniref:Reverse transcriptase domain-containing protein n=1 Tax=Acorus calamus TaxID=4465 RepID=A0AAV9BZ10_ACOCL|nr:hypothetical protein QJS10_CPB22g00311 [Acorus calamus]
MDNLKQLHEEGKADLESHFSEEEIKRACFGVDDDKSPGPDGFGLRFFQHFWDIVKADILDMFEGFFDNEFWVGCINASSIEEAVQIGEFRPICLLNGCYLLISKVLANRMRSVCGRIVEEEQSAFLPGCNLLEGFAITQELINDLHADGRSGVILKLDFSKAYDNVDWSFLLHLMSLHGFSIRWRRMIEQCISSARASVLVNGSSFGFFPLNRGLRQGDPLSPVLFALVANALCLMCKAAATDGWIDGLACRVRGSKLNLAQYADDTIIFGAPEVSTMGYRWFIRNEEYNIGLAALQSVLWKPKVPLKIKAFTLLVYQSRVLTKCYRAKWVLNASRTCAICMGEDESAKHLFCTCPAARELWLRVS